ncbi:MAG: hypothetical protein HYX28_04430 [Candidatus Koribacter versatilis]|uniref:Uncharacterized protein n=1 Tax=Candidatus Korobacter versatilis TaxID=658062 RepID=A0A932A791_9BACT|nr:hypothetical protein [Candidatus Koribacter versatilis]
MLNAKITQGNVDAGFLMPVPIYVELNDGRMVRVGQAPMLGNNTREFKIPLPGLKEKPKRALLNAYDDVLSGNQ